MLIDAHSHVFQTVNGTVSEGTVRELGYGRIAIGERTLQLLPPFNERTAYTAEMLIAQMDWAGVDRAYLLQGTYYGACNDYALEAIARYPERLAGAGWLDPWMPGARQAFAETFADHPAAAGFRAVKLEFSVSHGLSGLHPGTRLDDPALEWLWAEMERRGLALTLDLGGVGSQSYQSGAVRKIAQWHPGLKIVIAHLGQPTHRAEADPQAWAHWEEQIDLGRLPNVWFDSRGATHPSTGGGIPLPKRRTLPADGRRTDRPGQGALGQRSTRPAGSAQLPPARAAGAPAHPVPLSHRAGVDFARKRPTGVRAVISGAGAGRCAPAAAPNERRLP